MRRLASIMCLCTAALVASTGLGSCGEVLCGRDSRAVKGAEGLDKSYLARLHRDVASGQCRSRCSPDILDPLKSFSRRPPVLRMHPDGDASITLSACFDRGVELVFDDTKTDAATISVA